MYLLVIDVCEFAVSTSSTVVVLVIEQSIIFFVSCFFFFNDTATTEIYTDRSSAASDVYKRQGDEAVVLRRLGVVEDASHLRQVAGTQEVRDVAHLSLIHISEPTRPY